MLRTKFVSLRSSDYCSRWNFVKINEKINNDVTNVQNSIQTIVNEELTTPVTVQSTTMIDESVCVGISCRKIIYITSFSIL